MIPIFFERNFDPSLLSTVEACYSNKSFCFRRFSLTATSAAISIDGNIAVTVVLTIINDDHQHLSCSRGERTETVVKAHPGSLEPHWTG